MTRTSRIPLATTIAILLFFYIPIAILVVNSFNASSTGGAWGGWTLKWYQKLFANEEMWHAIRNSLVIGVTSTLVSTAIGTSAAFALYKYSETRIQKIHGIVLYMPLVVPEILMGISLLMIFMAVRLPLGLFAIFLAHVTFSMSYVAMVVLSRLQDFDATLIEAAQDLGADAWLTARRILLPLISPGIVAGALLAFTLSVDDFVITFFVSGPGSTTLPVQVYSMIKHSRNLPIINALSTLMMVATFVIVLTSQRQSRRA